MPELPDIEVDLFLLQSRIVGPRLEAVRIGAPFFLRAVIHLSRRWKAVP